MKRIFAICIMSLALIAGPLSCTNMSKTQQGLVSGGAIGALGGAGIAAIAGGSGVTGAVVGGIAGAIGGAVVGHNAE